ncbi:NUDIX domain-containing protein [Luedemannella flava]
MHRPILATLGYVVSPEGDRVLMVHRNKRPTDIHYGHYNGLGGKLESDEDVVTGIRREIYEESGLVADKVRCAARSPGPASARAARTGSASSSASTPGAARRTRAMTRARCTG